MSLTTPDTIDRRIRLARVRWRKKQPKIEDIPVGYYPARSAHSIFRTKSLPELEEKLYRLEQSLKP